MNYNTVSNISRLDSINQYLNSMSSNSLDEARETRDERARGVLQLFAFLILKVSTPANYCRIAIQSSGHRSLNLIPLAPLLLQLTQIVRQ